MVSPSFIKRTKNESFTSGSVKTQNDLINAGMNARSGIHVNLIKICSGLSVLYVQHIYVGYQPKHHVQENRGNQGLYIQDGKSAGTAIFDQTKPLYLTNQNSRYFCVNQ